MKHLFFFITLSCLLSACNGKKNSSKSFLSEYEVRFAADNGFEPLFKELTQLYALRKPEASMRPLYCSEDSALRLLVRDSLRLVIATRPLQNNEKERVKLNNLPLFQSRIAYDAFALIVNKENPDTAINLNEIRQILSGKITHWNQLEMGTRNAEISMVFDTSGSSTVRYMKDSLNNGKPLQGNMFAQGDNLSVIEAVRSNPNVMGVISTDWLRVNKGDTTVLNHFRDLDVRVMLVGRQGKKTKDWQRPYQYYIATGEYPLVRSLWAITTDPRSRSTTRSFYFFLKDNVGQRVICNSSQLLPINRVQVRKVNVSTR